jgi:hypothetical protein
MLVVQVSTVQVLPAGVAEVLPLMDQLQSPTLVVLVVLVRLIALRVLL